MQDPGTSSPWVTTIVSRLWNCLLVLVTITNTWDKSTYKEKRHIWGNGFRGSSPWSMAPSLWGPVARQHITVEQNHSLHGQKLERDKSRESRKPLQGPLHRSQEFPVGPHLKLSLLPNSTKLGTNFITHGPLGDTLEPNHSRANIKDLHNCD